MLHHVINLKIWQYTVDPGSMIVILLLVLCNYLRNAAELLASTRHGQYRYRFEGVAPPFQLNPALDLSVPSQVLS